MVTSNPALPSALPGDAPGALPEQWAEGAETCGQQRVSENTRVTRAGSHACWPQAGMISYLFSSLNLADNFYSFSRAEPPSWLQTLSILAEKNG